MKDLIILGGGSAGWLAALTIKKQFPGNLVTVIEDPNRPPIIAGESGGASLINLYKFLEIDFNEWIKETNALPKLGGKFFDWNGLGTTFTHGLIDQHYDKEFSIRSRSLAGINRDFLKLCLASNVPMENIFYNSALIDCNKLPIIFDRAKDTTNTIDTPMWHFDSRANAAYLKKLGLAQGIELVEGEYIGCEKDNNGNIYSLSLKDGTKILGDWFFDCSGFARLLLEKEVNSKFTDYTSLFPARSVVAWWEDQPKLINYTAITAMKYGWSWNINLKNRSGNGYVFDPDLIDLDTAVQEAEIRFNTKIEPVAKLNFTPSLTQECWKNNVIGIGLSTGFLEPLESNGLAQVVIQLELLEKYWNPEGSSEVETKLFNKYFNSAMEEILNFLSLHYKGNRRDTEFWRLHASKFERTSDFIRERLAAWRDGCYFEDMPHMQIYSMESYAAVASGLDLISREKLKNRLISKSNILYNDFAESHRLLNHRIATIVDTAMSMEEWYKLTYGEEYDQKL